MAEDLFRHVVRCREKLQIEESGSMLMVIGVLAKLIQDKGYGKSVDPEEILEHFQPACILDSWSGGNAPEWKWDAPKPNSCQKKVLFDFLKNGSSFKEVHPAILGQTYNLEEALSRQKQKGVFYTPWELVEVLKEMSPMQGLEDKRILDPSCGTGFILCGWYEELFEEHLKNGMSRDKAHERILKSQIYGMDVDPKAAWIATITIQLHHERFVPFDSVREGDFLLTKEELPPMDLVVGNPPYVGHKQLDRKYFKVLKDRYPEVYYDKADISYCFFQKGLEALKPGGKLAYITSRYYMEAQNAKGLRGYLTQHGKVTEILDYYGHRPFAQAQVDPAITVLEKTLVEPEEQRTCVRRYSRETGMLSDPYAITKNHLSQEGWTLLKPVESSIVEKIQAKQAWLLKDLWNSRQGIISGLDKAFVMDRDQESMYPRKYVKKWIKNRHISSFHIADTNMRLLYTDDLDDPDQEPAIYERMLPYKERLSNRRECKNGLRAWHHLQWGRKKEFFEGEKIVYPYKSHANRFAWDQGGSYYSADVYGFDLLSGVPHLFTNKSMVALLNSSLYNFYFQTFAKKLGGALYEYYPNTVGRMAIPAMDKNQVDRLEAFHAAMQSEDADEREKTLGELNRWVCSYFNITAQETDYLNGEMERLG